MLRKSSRLIFKIIYDFSTGKLMFYGLFNILDLYIFKTILLFIK